MATDFERIRRTVFMNLIAASASVKEQDLTVEMCIVLIEDIGREYFRLKAENIRLQKQVNELSQPYYGSR